MLLTVTVKKLNKRKPVPASLADTSSIAGAVFEGFHFEAVEADLTEVPNNAIGKWYKDRDGYFYWGGGLKIINVDAAAIDFETPEIGDENFGWGLKKLTIKKFWKSAANRGSNIKVAILDTGISSTHPEFDQLKISRYNVLTNGTDTEDFDGHGSHVAGIIAAKGMKTIGVAPDVHLLIIKIAEKTSTWEIGNVVKGIQYAIEQETDIISISGEFPKRNPDLDLLKQKIKDANSKGIHIISSAGNNFRNVPVESYPAAFDECISVGSITIEGTRADSSSLSTQLDLVAPGEEIFSTWAGEDYHTESGTSMATPMVAGIAAIIQSYSKTKNNKKLSPTEMQIILKKSADDAGEAEFDFAYGFGIINPLKAMELLKT